MDMNFFDYALLGVTAFNLGAIVWAGNKLREYSEEISRQEARAEAYKEDGYRLFVEGVRKDRQVRSLQGALAFISGRKISNPNGTATLFQRTAKEALDRAGF